MKKPSSSAPKAKPAGKAVRAPVSKLYAVILAGGRGERFWPLGRASRPKQFVDLFGGKPLIALAVERLRGLVPPERVLVVTSRDLVPATPEQRPAADDLAALRFPAGAACEIDVEFRAPVPVSNALEVVYSKSIRSILRDTALQPLSDRLVGPEKGVRR